MNCDTKQKSFISMICYIAEESDLDEPAFASSMHVVPAMNEVKDLMLLKRTLQPDQSGQYENLHDEVRSVVMVRY